MKTNHAFEKRMRERKQRERREEKERRKAERKAAKSTPSAPDDARETAVPPADDISPKVDP